MNLGREPRTSPEDTSQPSLRLLSALSRTYDYSDVNDGNHPLKRDIRARSNLGSADNLPCAIDLAAAGSDVESQGLITREPNRRATLNDYRREDYCREGRSLRAVTGRSDAHGSGRCTARRDLRTGIFRRPSSLHRDGPVDLHNRRVFFRRTYRRTHHSDRLVYTHLPGHQLGMGIFHLQSGSMGRLRRRPRRRMAPSAPDHRTYDMSNYSGTNDWPFHINSDRIADLSRRNRRSKLARESEAELTAELGRIRGDVTYNVGETEEAALLASAQRTLEQALHDVNVANEALDAELSGRSGTGVAG